MERGEAGNGADARGLPYLSAFRRAIRGGGPAILVAVLAACATPEPLSGDQISARIAADREVLIAAQDPVTAPVTLEEAIARSIKHNLDHRIKAMETALAQGEADLAHWDLLPRVTTNAGYTARSNDNGSSSRSLRTGTQSLEPSTSSDKDYETASLSTAWNVLDFGVTYLRAKQQMDRKLIAEERRRKVVQNFVQDVRYAWWKAVSAQRLLPQVESLRTEAQHALDDSRAVQGRGLQAPTPALEYQMSLLETLRQIGTLQRDLVLAKTELGTLMGLSPGTKFDVARPDGELEVPRIPSSLDKLQGDALLSRPELREEDYNERIGAAETRKAILRLLPGLEMTSDLQYNGNSFLANQSWMEGGLRLSWNLINLASGPQNIKLSEAREELVRKRRLALSMAVLAQVNVAWIRYHQARQDFALTSELYDVAARLRTQAETARAATAETGLETIRRSSRAVFMELQRDTAYAELQNSAGRVFVSSGADPLPETVGATDLPTLAAAIGRTMRAWEEGRPTSPTAYAPGSLYYLTEETYVWAEPEADAALSGTAERCAAVRSIAFKDGWHQLEGSTNFSDGWVPERRLIKTREDCIPRRAQTSASSSAKQ